jgi:hypothetical protein
VACRKLIYKNNVHCTIGYNEFHKLVDHDDCKIPRVLSRCVVVYLQSLQKVLIWAKIISWQQFNIQKSCQRKNDDKMGVFTFFTFISVQKLSAYNFFR